MRKIKVHWGSAGIERVEPFKYRQQQFYAEDHCFCGWMVSDKNRMGVFVDHPAYLYFIEKVLPKLSKK